MLKHLGIIASNLTEEQKKELVDYSQNKGIEKISFLEENSAKNSFLLSVKQALLEGSEFVVPESMDLIIKSKLPHESLDDAVLLEAAYAELFFSNNQVLSFFDIDEAVEEFARRKRNWGK